MKNSILAQAFEVLTERDVHFEKIGRDEYQNRVIWGQILLIFLFTFFYGLIMGSYNSVAQALITGLKLWMLLFLTLIICFPSFYIVQLILGSKIKIRQLLILILSGFVMTTTIMVAFAPITLFFQLSGGNYSFLQLLHVFVFFFSGFFGMRVVLDALKSTFEASNVYPKVGISVFRIWIVIFAFVGIQLSWNLRPFIGNRDMPFEILRTDTRGNFYSTVFGALGNLFDGPNRQIKSAPKVEEIPSPDSIPSKDSITIGSIPQTDTQ